MDKKVFFQDFLFKDMPVDEQDYPEIQMNYVTDSQKDLSDCRIVSFDRLLRMNKENEWEALFQSVVGCDVVLVDDLRLHNPEMQQYKRFYLGAYYYNLTKHCRECHVKSLL